MKDFGTATNWEGVFTATRFALGSGMIQGLAIVSLDEFNSDDYEAMRLDGNGRGLDDGTLDRLARETPTKIRSAVQFRLFIERMKMPRSSEPWFEAMVVVYLKGQQEIGSVQVKTSPHKSLQSQNQFHFRVGWTGYLGD